MAAERINSIADIAALEAEKAKIIQILDDTSASLSNLQKQAGTIELKLGDVKTVTELNAALKELKATTKEISGLTLDQAKAVKTLAEAEVKLEQANLATEKTNGQKIKNQKDELALAATLEKSIDKINAARKREEKQLEELNNDYLLLKKAYVDTSEKAKQLGVSFGVNSQIFKQTAADAKTMYDRLLQVEMAVGQGQRQVGQYNIVGAQFNQLLRELPNAGISVRTFIISLTNNISYFGEAVGAALKEGQSWKQILGTMGKSMFGLVGVLNIAILAFTFLSKEIGKNKDEQKELGDQVEDTTKKLIDQIDAMNKRRTLESNRQDSGINQLKRELLMLEAQGASEEKIYAKRQEIRNRELANINKEIETYKRLELAMGRVSNEAIKNTNKDGTPVDPNKPTILDELIGQSNLKDIPIGVLSTIVSDLKNAYIEEISTTEAFNRRMATLEDERLDKEAEVASAEAGLHTKQTEEAKKAYEKRLKDYEQYLKQREELRQALQKASNSFRNGDVDELQGAVNQIMGAGDGANNIIMGGFFKGIMKAKEKAMNDIAREEAAAMIGIENSYAAGLYSWEEYEKAKTDATLRFADKRTDAEIKALKAALEFLPENSAARIEIEKKINDIELANLKKHNKKKEDADKESAEKRKQIAKKVEEEMQVMYFRMAGEFNRSTFSMINSVYEKEKLKNDKTAQDIENTLTNKVNMINATFTNEEQRIRDIAAAEAKAQQDREKLQDRQRELARRQAAFQKASAMTEIIINTAAAIAKQMRETPLPQGAPLIKAIAAMGAMQLLTAAAQPLPQYAEGTTDHQGGKFIAGDGGERELVVRPDGRMYWTDDKPKVYDEPKHTKVLNSDMITGLYATLAPKMLQTLEDKRNKTDKQLADRLERALNKNTQATVAAIKKNRARVNVMGNNTYYQTHVKGTA